MNKELSHTTVMLTFHVLVMMQFKRIQIPTFSGDKRSYRNWKSVFMACVDTAPATDEYKLLQLRQCLSGEALNVIENLGHSTAAYEAAKERLERRYGGKRRQVAIYLNDIDKFPQVRPGNAQDIQKFADLLEIAIMNLKETDHQSELGNGFLYAKLQTKLAESMLARYHRWVFETQTQVCICIKDVGVPRSRISNNRVRDCTRHSLHYWKYMYRATARFVSIRQPNVFRSNGRPSHYRKRNLSSVRRGSQYQGM